jgi:hypothetical protein
MTVIRKWEFRSKFRTNVYGWRGSSLAISRLKDAVAEIRAVAKLNPVLAGDGIVTLAERIWQAFQGIDTSSGALGSAIYRTLNDLVPLLIAAPADQVTRGKWLTRLYEAVQNDGVEYLSPLEERWAEIAQYRDSMDDYANRLICLIRQAWSTDHEFAHINGLSICLSCLLERGRYDELQELLAIHRRKFWPWHKYGAEALVGTEGPSERKRTVAYCTQCPSGSEGAGFTLDFSTSECLLLVLDAKLSPALATQFVACNTYARATSLRAILVARNDCTQ